MGEGGAVRDVADRVDRRIRRPLLIVDGDEPARPGAQPGVLELEVVGVGDPAHRHQHVAGLHRLGCAVVVEMDVAAVDRDHRGAGADGDAEAVEGAGHDGDDVVVELAEDPIGDLDDRHAAAEPGVGRTELDADVAAADDEQIVGHLGQRQRAGGVEDPFLVDRQRGQRRRPGSGGDDRMVELQVLDMVLGLDRDAVTADEASGAADDLDVAQERSDAVPQPVDDAVLPALGGRQVDVDVADDPGAGRRLGAGLDRGRGPPR